MVIAIAKNHRRSLVAAFALGLAITVQACTPTVDYRGYLPRQGDMQQLQIGMSKTEVEALLGSPSTTATVNYTGDSYYYISSIVEQRGFLDAKEVDRKVFALRFNQDDQLESFAHYGLEDGRVIDINSRETPTRGKELSILQQVFSNIGRFDPAVPQ